jgi:hypothetical protein
MSKVTDTVLLGGDSCDLELWLIIPNHNTVDVHRRAYSKLYGKESYYQKMFWAPEEKRPYFAIRCQVCLEEVPSVLYCTLMLDICMMKMLAIKMMITVVKKNGHYKRKCNWDNVHARIVMNELESISIYYHCVKVF